MLIATITALLLVGGSGANWMLEQIAGIRDQVKAEVHDEAQRKQLLDILGEMKSISKTYAKSDKGVEKSLRKMIQDYDTPVDEIGGAMLRDNLERSRYQKEMLAERFRMIEATDEQLWARIFPGD